MSKISLTWSKLIPLKKSEIDKLNDIGGAYRLSKKSEDENYYIFYIGSSENIKDKLLQHLSASEENSRLKSYLQQPGDFVFRYAVIAEKSIQEAVEKQMYKTYLPMFNQTEPKSTIDIEANLN